MSSRRKTEAGKEEQRTYAKTRYDNLTPEEKQLRSLRKSRRYYLTKGVIPYPSTPLGKWCIVQGYDIEKVMNGEQPI